jgi:hypothetical protein
MALGSKVRKRKNHPDGIIWLADYIDKHFIRTHLSGLISGRIDPDWDQTSDDADYEAENQLTGGKSSETSGEWSGKRRHRRKRSPGTANVR